MTTLPKHYHNAHVLVVDDDPISREIVESLLAAVGIIAHMAEHGQHALDILSEASPDAFDLVLMDIQMPFMDGRTATRALRSRPEFALLPIIGVTALTMEHQKTTSAEAGLSDHIGKPYDSAAFYRMLEKWIPKSKQKAPRALEELAQQPAPIPIVGDHVRSLRGVDVREAIDRLGGKEDRYLHWLADFVTTAGAIPDTIRSEIAAGFPGTAAKRLQAFKARVGMLGMTELHDAVVVLDLALRNGIAVDGLLAGLERSIGEMSNEVARALGMECTI